MIVSFVFRSSVRALDDASRPKLYGRFSASGVSMSGRSRLPGGERRKASQRNTRRTSPIPARIAPSWRPGDQVRWKDRSGVFRRDVGDGEHVEIAIGERVYRVRAGELA